MRIQHIEIYSFEELSEEAQKRAIKDRMRLLSQEETPFLSDDLEQELYNQLEINKIKVLDKPKLSYSLSNSQGDGLSFEGRFEYKGVVFKSYRLTRMYSYAQTVKYECEQEEFNYPLERVEEFYGLYRLICANLVQLGYSWIEHYSGEEYAREDLINNECEFLKSGEWWTE